MATLTFQQIEQLWTSNGGSPTLAPVMAAIALAESGGRTDAVNNNPGTGDYSVGLFQINYYGGLLQSRSSRFGTPQQLAADPNAQARAAITLAGPTGAGLSNWTTYTSGAYKGPLSAHTSGLTGDSLGKIQLISTTSQEELGPPSQPFGPNVGPSTLPPQEGCLIPAISLPVGGSIGGDCLMQRSTARRIVGAAALVGGGVLMLIGIGFVSRTARRAAGAVVGGPVGAVTGLAGQRADRRTMMEREQVRQEGIDRRQDMRAQRRRQQEAETTRSAIDSEEPF